MIVFISAGASRFHERRDCGARERTQLLNDWTDSWEQWGVHSRPTMHALKEVTLEDAYSSGKWPCSFCCTDFLIPYNVRKKRSFGHERVVLEGVEFCLRCRVDINMIFAPKGSWFPVQWPCASARVLGLQEDAG